MLGDRKNTKYEKLDDDELEGVELRYRRVMEGPQTPDSNVPMPDKMDAGLDSPISYRERDTVTKKHTPSLSASSQLSEQDALKATKQRIPKRRFEKPDRNLLIIHMISCLLVYPFLYCIARLAQNMSLFLVRVYVGLGCAIVGTIVGYTLVSFAKRYMQSAIWATLIHQSDAPAQTRISLHELSSVAEDTGSPITALWLMYYRRRAFGIESASKRSMDHRIWTFFIIFFLVLVCTATGLSFIFGRLVGIVVQPSFDMTRFTEVPVFADLTRDDQSIYYDQAANFRLTNWENLPVAWNNTLPSYIAAPLPPNSGTNTTESQMIYFPEAYPEQLRADGFGLSAVNMSVQELGTEGPAAQRNVMRVYKGEEDSGGQLLQFARWGTRSVCSKLDNMSDVNNFEYVNNGDFVLVHIHNNIVNSLFERLGSPIPDGLQDRLQQKTPFFNTDNTVPELVWPDESALNQDILVTVNSTFSSTTGSIIKADWIIDDGNGTFTGWLFMGVVVIRVRQQLTRNATFPFYYNATLAANVLGYDAAICLDIVEPWVAEVFNSTRGPSSTRLLGKGGSLNDVPQVGKAKVTLGEETWELGRNLNSTDKYYPFRQIHAQANREWMLLSDMMYSVSNIIISWTNGTGPWGYTSLSADRLANFRSVTLATRGLPLFAGSRRLVARSYPSITLASARIETVPMIATIATLFVLGITAGLCVPTLPQGKPRRGVDLISWIAALEGDGLQIEKDGEATGKVNWELQRGEEVEEVEKDYGNGKVRYPID